MENNIISNIKEFIWDIIGYLIPGFLLILVLNFILNPSIAIDNDFLIDWNSFGQYLIVIISYILGYVVYSLTILKIRIQDKILNKFKKCLPKLSDYTSDGWEEKFKESSTYKNSIIFLNENGFKEAEKMKTNEIRNILMSRDPSMDQKVYTFMFRSSVFDHISTILISVIFLVIIQYILSFYGIYFLKVSIQFKVFYVLCIIMIPLLGNCKRIFFPIAKRIPFSNLKK